MTIKILNTIYYFSLFAILYQNPRLKYFAWKIVFHKMAKNILERSQQQAQPIFQRSEHKYFLRTAAIVALMMKVRPDVLV